MLNAEMLKTNVQRSSSLLLQTTARMYAFRQCMCHSIIAYMAIAHRINHLSERNKIRDIPSGLNLSEPQREGPKPLDA